MTPYLREQDASLYFTSYFLHDTVLSHLPHCIHTHNTQKDNIFFLSCSLQGSKYGYTHCASTTIAHSHCISEQVLETGPVGAPVKQSSTNVFLGLVMRSVGAIKRSLMLYVNGNYFVP